METSGVYSQVLATLSNATVDVISGNQQNQIEFLTAQLGSLGVLIYQMLDQNEICVAGKLDQVVHCAEILEKKLANNMGELDIKSEGEVGCYICNKRKKNKTVKEVGINCDLMQSNNILLLGDQEQVYGHAKIELVNDADDEQVENLAPERGGEIVRGTNKQKKLSGIRSKRKIRTESMDPEYRHKFKSRSKFGRAIKVPSKFVPENKEIILKEEENECLPTDGEMDDEIKKEVDKTGLDDQVNDNDKNDDIENNVNDGDNSGLNKITSELLNSMVRVKIATGDKKSIKKYYEDRMPFKYFCSQCSFKSKRQAHFEKHVAYHKKHPNIELFECDQCEFRAVRASVLFRHKLTHEEILIRCPKCSYETNTQKNLDIHVKLKHDQVGKASMVPLSCKHCNFTSLSRTKLSMHVKFEHTVTSHGSAETDGLFRCAQPCCDYVSKKKVNLIRHQDNVHSDKRPHLCDLCGRSFKRKDALTVHKETHMDKSKRRLPFSCDKCGKAFKANATLKEHQSVHTSQRSHQCHVCGQMFKSIMVQRRHIQSIHYNPCKYHCSTCKRSFSSKYALKRHERTHDDLNVGLTLADLQTKILEGNITQGQSIEGEGQMELDQGDKIQIGTGSDNMVTVDESISAIETITITSENLGEFAQQLQSVSSQLQSGNDVGEVYIQGMDNPDSHAVNIVNVPGDIRQILVSSNDTNHQDLESSTVVDDNPNQAATEIFVTDSEPQNMKELYIQTEICDEPIKQANSQLIGDVASSSELFNQAQPVFDLGSLENENLIQQGQINTADGQVLELVAQDGQTYRFKLETLPPFLSLPSNNSSSQTE